MLAPGCLPLFTSDRLNLYFICGSPPILDTGSRFVVEALFLAYHILGRPTEGLLDHYHWAEEFLKLNGLGT